MVFLSKSPKAVSEAQALTQGTRASWDSGGRESASLTPAGDACERAHGAGRACQASLFGILRPGPIGIIRAEVGHRPDFRAPVGACFCLRRPHETRFLSSRHHRIRCAGVGEYGRRKIGNEKTRQDEGRKGFESNLHRLSHLQVRACSGRG